MGLLLIVVLCVLAAFAGARGALIVPIVLWPIDRLPWPSALLSAALALIAWRAFSAPRLPLYRNARPLPVVSVRRIPPQPALPGARDHA